MIRNADYVMSLIVDPLGLAKKAQVGVDLTIRGVSRIYSSPGSPDSTWGIIYNDESSKDGFKTSFGKYRVMDLMPYEGHMVYVLPEGTYSVEFDQGINPLPENNTAFIWQRSTLGRNGLMVRSSVYDPGFTSPNMGAILFVGRGCILEAHSRIAQIVVHENEPTTLYDGSYQGKKDFR